ncbi:Pentulose kinase [Meira miltonrushii]|uniref:Pentulose kinase n=1 Tax=Meira miltonrushii TaxID=1280837 RepID=A0A316V9C0_9BASI|nr:Pentulose kinase [Meira miltonrushii]PWN32075.1 Pentulose kinase [Meira miltonrushii]
MTSNAGPFYIGVDVGTGSARAALVNLEGTILSESTYATKTHRLESDARIFEQSTTNIWSQICTAVKDVLKSSGVSKDDVKGLGFDATCSLAVTDAQGQPIQVTPKSTFTPGDRNVILWADHRAEEEAKLINSTGNMVLNYVGKTMSLEMEIPKVLWLKKHMPADVFQKCMFFDLPDYLTYRATGDTARSNCSLVCKCSYVPPGVDGSELGWQPDFFKTIGLDDLIKNDFAQLGGIPGRNGMVLTAGQPVGRGLTEQAAAELGLQAGTAVGSGLIDAYAGWVGTIAAKAKNGPKDQSTNLIDSQYRLAAIAGTSTCHCIQSPEGILVDGVWGPYKHAVFPGMWMNEGGQSSTGQLIDFIIDTHPASERLKGLAQEKGTSIFALLHGILDDLSKERNAPTLSHLTHDLTIYPDLHGNRSPLADSSMRGLISGLKLDQGSSDLALKYYATLEAIALQTRHIIESMNAKGHQIKRLYMSGGQVKNAVFMQLMADTCGIDVQLPYSHSASVVAGSAILGRFAHELQEKGIDLSGVQQDLAEKASFEHRDRLWQLMVDMTKPGTLVHPNTKDETIKRILDAKYTVFTEAIETQRRWRSIVSKAM